MEKKFTLITGASSGLGKELAKLYAKDKNNLLLVARNLDSLNKLKEEVDSLYKVEVDVLSKDLSNLNEVKEIKDYVLKKGYFINNLVNNAGFGDTKDFVDMDIDFNIKLNEVNINALMYLTHFFLKDMLKNDEGHIINVASVAGFLPSPHMSTYHASKAYIIYLTEAISEEIKKSKVKVLAVCPGPFESNFVNVAHNYKTFETIKPMTTEYVAKKTYKVSLKGKKVVYVLPFKSKLLSIAPRFFTRKFVNYVAGKTLEEK